MREFVQRFNRELVQSFNINFSQLVIEETDLYSLDCYFAFQFMEYQFIQIQK